MLDEQLRDELASWADAAGRLPVPDVSVLRRRVRRRRTRLTMACAGLAAAAVGAVALVANLPSVLNQPPPADHGTGWRPAGPPVPPDAGVGWSPYFVTLEVQPQHAPAVISDALTGGVIGVVSPPAAAGPDGFQLVSAAADGRTFVLAGERPAGGQMQFYELQLGSGGRPLPLRPLRLPVQTADLLFSLSPDGTKLAVTVEGQTAIEVIELTTGQHRLWRPAAHRQVTGLAWAGTHELAVSWFRVASALAKTVGPSGGLGLLPVGTAGGSLAEIRLLIPARVAFGRFHGDVNPLVSADGSVIYGTMTSNGPNRQAEVVEFSGSTGKPLRAVSPATYESGMGQWCGAVWADPSGQQVAIACASLGLGEGVTSHGKFSRRDLHLPIHNESVPTASFIAW
jgi:hypothetical protein